MVSLHYNESNSFLFVNAAKIYQYKSEVSEIKPYIPCLGNISKDFTMDNMRKTGLNGVVKVFPVDYFAIGNNDIFYIRRYLMKEV